MAGESAGGVDGDGPALPGEDEGSRQGERDEQAERVLGGRRELSSRQVSSDAGVSLPSARQFWRALGFPDVGEDMQAFTEADVDALHRVSRLVRDGLLDDTTALALTRAVGRSVDRLASWQVQLLGEALVEQRAMQQAGGSDAATDAGHDVGVLAMVLADEFEPLLVYAWRRHLASALHRYQAEVVPDPDVPTMQRAVGFADLVSFTRVVRRLSERDLAVLVQRFEAVTSDVVTSHGGRIIKTVGDEVLFVAWPPPAAAAIALDIASEIGADPLMPDVRVGVATGQVVARLGDVFGTTVNRASRLTSIAAPGTVLVDDATARVLTSISGFTCTPLRRRTLKGIGTVAPWLLTRSSRGGTGTTGRAPVDVEAVEKAVEAPDATEDRPLSRE